MRNMLDELTQNLIRLATHERARQLEEVSDNLNILEKQLDLEDLANEIILRANKAPFGLIEVVFTDKRVRDNMKPEEILRNCKTKICGFNVEDPKTIRTLFRTVIVVDARWSNNLRVYQSEYNLPNSYLK